MPLSTASPITTIEPRGLVPVLRRIPGDDLSLSDYDHGGEKISSDGGIFTRVPAEDVGTGAGKIHHPVKNDSEETTKKLFGSSTWAHNHLDSSSSEDENVSQSSGRSLDSEQVREFREQRRTYLRQRSYQRSYSDPSLDAVQLEDISAATQDESDALFSQQRTRTASWAGTGPIPTLIRAEIKCEAQEHAPEVMGLEQQRMQAPSSGTRRRPVQTTPEGSRITSSRQLSATPHSNPHGLNECRPTKLSASSKASRLATCTPFRSLTILFFIAVSCTAFLDVPHPTNPTYNLVDDAFETTNEKAEPVAAIESMNSLSKNTRQEMLSQQALIKKTFERSSSSSSSTASRYTGQANLRGVAPIGLSFGRKSQEVVFTYEKPRNTDTYQLDKQQKHVNLKRKEVEQFFKQEGFTNYMLPWYANAFILFIVAFWAIYEQHRKGLTLCD